MLKAVTFDATGTLLHSPRLGEIYSSVLARHGVEVTPARAGELIRLVWTELDCAVELGRDRFSSHPGGPRGWWRRFLDRFCEYLEVAPASPFAAAELYDRFGRADAWELFGDVEPVLASLRGQGLRLAVVANWDARLPGVLRGLGIESRFQHIVYSAEAGFEKPHPGIFESALARLGCEPREVLHVGDDRRRDFEGALGVGMHAVHFDRGGGGELRSLDELEGSTELWYVGSGS